MRFARIRCILRGNAWPFVFTSYLIRPKSRFLGEGMDKITYASLAALGPEFHETFDAAIGHVREDLEETHPLFIGGKPRKSKDGTFADTNPADTRIVLGHFQRGSR